MTTNPRSLLLTAVTLALLGQSSQAVDITIFDKITHFRSNPSTRQWWGDNSLAPGVQHPDPRGIAEDNETEPGSAVGQHWDLEAFHLQGTTLSVIGGFNFMSGQGTYASGDIFIDVDGDAVYGTDLGGGGTQLISNSLFGFDYVIDFQQTVNGSFDSTVSSIGPKYTVYRLDENSTSVVSVAFPNNSEANPWIYHSGGQAVAGHVDRDIGVGLYTGGRYAGWGSNNTHHMITVDLGFLGNSVPDATLFKFTMECGNDNLVGRSPVPDGGTPLMLLSGAAILVSAARRKLNNSALEP